MEAYHCDAEDARLAGGFFPSVEEISLAAALQEAFAVLRDGALNSILVSFFLLRAFRLLRAVDPV